MTNAECGNFRWDLLLDRIYRRGVIPVTDIDKRSFFSPLLDKFEYIQGDGDKMEKADFPK